MIQPRPRLLRRATAPASEPVTLAEAKLFLRVDGSAEDTLITALIEAARGSAEEYLGRSLITQIWQLAYDDYLESGTPLPRGPVSAIASVTSYDEAQTPTVIDVDVYRLNAARTHIELDSAVLGHRVEVSYTAGYGAAADVPAPIRHGVLLHVAALYDNRESPLMPDAARACYASFRELRL